MGQQTTEASAADAGPRDARVPDKPTVDGLEDRWAQVWQEQGTYLFDRTKTREQVYSIDTPPPTVSGRCTSGHVFSYTHTDIVARYQRMRASRCSTPMAGTTTGSRPSAGANSISASGATRRCPTTRLRPAEKPDASAQCRSLRRISSSSAER
jgi:valyl-tRNA synthetase